MRHSYKTYILSAASATLRDAHGCVNAEKRRMRKSGVCVGCFTFYYLDLAFFNKLLTEARSA